MSDSALDPTAFTELQEATGPEFAAELLATFLDEAPGMLADLHAGAANQDAETFRRAAHSIKSNAEVFGAVTLGTMARDLELNGCPAEPQEALHALSAAYDRAAAELEALADV